MNDAEIEEIARRTYLNAPEGLSALDYIDLSVRAGIAAMEPKLAAAESCVAALRERAKEAKEKMGDKNERISRLESVICEIEIQLTCSGLGHLNNPALTNCFTLIDRIFNRDKTPDPKGAPR